MGETSEVAILTGAVRELTVQAQRQAELEAERNAQQRRKNRIGAAIIIFDVLFTIGFALVYNDRTHREEQVRQQAITNRQIIEELRTQGQAMRDAICPTSAEIAKLPIPPNASESGKKLFQVYRDVYERLCVAEYGPLPPPATPTPAPSPTR